MYDDAGRLVRSTTMRDAEWTDQDRTEMLALAEYRASLCPNGCGQLLEESTSRYDVGPAYEAKRTTCRACVAVTEAKRGDAEAEKRTGGQGYSAARVWRIEKTKG